MLGIKVAGHAGNGCGAGIPLDARDSDNKLVTMVTFDIIIDLALILGVEANTFVDGVGYPQSRKQTCRTVTKNASCHCFGKPLFIVHVVDAEINGQLLCGYKARSTTKVQKFGITAATHRIDILNVTVAFLIIQ